MHPILVRPFLVDSFSASKVHVILHTLLYSPFATMAVTLHTTHGPLKLELYCEACPKTCENFLALCASGYFDDVPFHRNMKGFVVQTGDGELKTGKGGKSIWGSFFEDEISPALRHNARGVVSMANKGEGTNGSQFFICYSPQVHLDGKNTVFAKVSRGMGIWRNCYWARPGC